MTILDPDLRSSPSRIFARVDEHLDPRPVLTQRRRLVERAHTEKEEEWGRGRSALVRDAYDAIAGAPGAVLHCIFCLDHCISFVRTNPILWRSSGRQSAQ